MKSIVIISLFILIIIAIGIIAVVLNYSDDNNDTDNLDYDYYYHVRINANGTDNYNLIVPIVINIINYNTSTIMNDIVILGTGNYSIINTTYGPGLQIFGLGNISIKVEGYSYVDFGILSLKYDSDNDGTILDEQGRIMYWYYYDAHTNSSLELEIESVIRHNASSYTSRLFYTSVQETGWSTTNGSENITIP